MSSLWCCLSMAGTIIYLARQTRNAGASMRPYLLAHCPLPCHFLFPPKNLHPKCILNEWRCDPSAWVRWSSLLIWTVTTGPTQFAHMWFYHRFPGLSRPYTSTPDSPVATSCPISSRLVLSPSCSKTFFLSHVAPFPEFFLFLLMYPSTDSISSSNMY